MKHRRFFHELTPWANRIAELAEQTPPRLSEAKDVPGLINQRQAKLARRVDRARKGGQL